MTLDPESLLKFAAALAFVVALIAGVAWVAKRFVPGAGAMSSAGRKRRLQTVEILPLDSSRIVAAMAGHGDVEVCEGDGHLLAKSGRQMWDRLEVWLPEVLGLN